MTRPNEGDVFDLPSGEVVVGTALMDIGDMLEVGKIRVGGRDGEVLDVGSVSKGRFLEALSLCHRAGQVRLPSDAVCDDAVSSFDHYRIELRQRCTQTCPAEGERPSPTESHSRGTAASKALQWRKPS